MVEAVLSAGGPIEIINEIKEKGIAEKEFFRELGKEIARKGDITAQLLIRSAHQYVPQDCFLEFAEGIIENTNNTGLLSLVGEVSSNVSPEIAYAIFLKLATNEAMSAQRIATEYLRKACEKEDTFKYMLSRLTNAPPEGHLYEMLIGGLFASVGDDPERIRAFLRLLDNDPDGKIRKNLVEYRLISSAFIEKLRNSGDAELEEFAKRLQQMLSS